VSYGAVRLVRSPYRACPLGAHVDHQLGQVTGMALDRALLMAFAPQTTARVRLRSRQFPGTVQFDLNRPSRAGDWADYARGAAWALSRRHALTTGICALMDGHDDVGGLSSSAAAGVAYLLALEAANGLEVGPADNVELDRLVENEFIGLSNGILDQSVILLSRPRHLTWLDCLTGQSRLVACGADEPAVGVLFSGLRRPLLQTDYNRRVAECREAAALLLRAAGLPVPPQAVLRAVPEEVYLDRRDALPAPLRRRADHFFGEADRVRRGVSLWETGDLRGFGALMSESGRSSIENYECGNPYLRAACEVLLRCPGVYGARFSGAGFRGCCVALADPAAEEELAEAALSGYLEAYPDMAGLAKVYFCRSGPGAALLE
jgi:galactokinase/galacturonokinase